jgi:hypothetical protein
MTGLEERILDLALDEVVGGRTPPDVTDRVLATLSRRPSPPSSKERWRILIMTAAALLFSGVLFVVVQQEDPSTTKIRKLIDNLRSEEEIDRSYGVFALKEMGRAAQAELQKATLDKNPEVATQAKQLLRRLDILDQLTPKLQKVFPEVEDRLCVSDETWLVVLRQAVERIKLSEAKREKPPLGREDLEILAAPAVRGAVTDLQKQEAILYVLQYQLRSATPETAKLLKDEALMKSLSPMLRTTCMNHLSELWRHAREYAKASGRMPKETGADFWQALVTAQPPILEANSEFLICPARFLAGPQDGRTGRYWGPKGDVEKYEYGDAVGLCDDPLHGSYAIFITKAADIMAWSRKAPLVDGAKAKLKAPGEK